MSGKVHIRPLVHYQAESCL